MASTSALLLLVLAATPLVCVPQYALAAWTTSSTSGAVGFLSSISQGALLPEKEHIRFS